MEELMAKTSKENSSQILTTDATKSGLTRKTIASEPKTYTRSRKRTSLQEFAFVNNLRPEILAGFKAWLNGELFHFDDEWKELFNKYQNR